MDHETRIISLKVNKKKYRFKKIKGKKILKKILLQ
jgi:hypothetical protein